MKFRRNAATIAIYFLFTLLWMNLFINASDDEQQTVNIMKRKREHEIDENTNINLDLATDVITNTLQQTSLHTPVSLSKNILSKIFKFLNIHDILIVRQMSRKFQILLHPNDQNMVRFCKNFGSNEMDDDVPLIWSDLKYFPNQSSVNALENIELLLLQHNQYAVFTHDKKIISWYNEQASDFYDKMIINKIQNGIYQIPRKRYEPSKIKLRHVYSVKLTIEGNIRTGGRDGYCTYLEQLQNVQMIKSSGGAFAAVLGDRSVIAWGYGSGGKIPESIQTQLKNVKTIFSTRFAFAALLHDGNVIAWGGPLTPEYDEYTELQQTRHLIHNGGKIPESIQIQLKNVKTIFSTEFAFAALLHDGNVIAWGRENTGGKIPDNIQTQLHQNVKMIFSNHRAFVALLNNDRFVAWGDESCGGKITDEIQTQLNNLSKGIFSSSYAFAALLNDGTVFTWGHPRFGGKIPDEVQSKLMNNVEMIFPQINGFTALCKNNKMISWGEN